MSYLTRPALGDAQSVPAGAQADGWWSPGIVPTQQELASSAIPMWGWVLGSLGLLLIVRAIRR